MEQKFALLLHVLAVVIWVGGMFFAYMALRPAAVATLEPPQRLPLWAATFARFFPWVWASVLTLLASGLYMISLYGGFGAVAHYIVLMFGLGVIMMLLFAHVYFAPYQRLRRNVLAQQWPAAGSALGQIRLLIAINLSLGLLTILIAVLGKLFA